MDRDALLARIIADGDRRRLRRRAAIGSALAVTIALIGAVVAWPGADDDRERVEVADTGEVEATTTSSMATTPTGPDATATTTVVDPAPTTTTAPDEASDVTATTPVTEPELVCRNSYDERCGPFYWDLPPGFVNQPITISAEAEPLRATAGQETRLTFRADDADADACVDIIDLGGGRLTSQETRCMMEACGTASRYGPWDPPAIDDHERLGTGRTNFPQQVEPTVIYDTPGTYTITVNAFSFTRCGGADLYHSSATSTFTIEVAPA